MGIQGTPFWRPHKEAQLKISSIQAINFKPMLLCKEECLENLRSHTC